MLILRRVMLLRRIDHLIRRKATGNYLDLSEKLEISPATLYRQLNELKALGAPIAYNRFKKTFYYQEEFELIF